jgi:hypothetical protein
MVRVFVSGMKGSIWFPNAHGLDIGTTLAERAPPADTYTVTLELQVVTQRRALLTSADGLTFTEFPQPADIALAKTRTLSTTDIAKLRLPSCRSQGLLPNKFPRSPSIFS